MIILLFRREHMYLPLLFIFPGHEWKRTRTWSWATRTSPCSARTNCKSFPNECHLFRINCCNCRDKLKNVSKSQTSVNLESNNGCSWNIWKENMLPKVPCGMISNCPCTTSCSQIYGCTMVIPLFRCEHMYLPLLFIFPGHEWKRTRTWSCATRTSPCSASINCKSFPNEFVKLVSRRANEWP